MSARPGGTIPMNCVVSDEQASRRNSRPMPASRASSSAKATAPAVVGPAGGAAAPAREAPGRRRRGRGRGPERTHEPQLLVDLELGLLAGPEEEPRLDLERVF